MDFWEDLIAQRHEAEERADPVAMRQKLLRKQEGDCFWCHVEMLPFDRTLDHVIPHSQGGPYVIGNMVLAHEDCNKRRGSRFSDHLLQRLSDGVLALAIENLQTLRADAYEATSENQACVLEARKRMEDTVWTLLIQRWLTRHNKFVADGDRIRERRRQAERRVEKQDRWRRDEHAFLKKVAELQKTKIGIRIARYEKRNKITPVTAKPQTTIRRPRSARR